MTFVDRHARDKSQPTVREEVRDLALRAIAPAVLLCGALVGVGWVVENPLRSMAQTEDALSRGIQQYRTPLWDGVTMVWSRLGNTEVIIGCCLVAVAVLWWRTRRWWYAVIPGIAVSLQASVFVATTAITGRPRPEAAQLDPAPPTSSFPSGHVGASVALYGTAALMVQQIERVWLRRLLTGLCLLVPLLVGYARFYRGMHHVSDIFFGLLNGLSCVVLAWWHLRRRAR